ncbi:hypothetical protein [Ktedonospora formicarum]|uniref:Uncharacterized protein n=1 Tax=Ktedonospora formicarum TaxID=2778364 RepID=A0A8J3MRG7_9CHLR|nr:hypothetical protein [Ktedonospora formicarum]GHO43766.1 hypothetical protein KSX_19290 [Ktedonospora formicarum]
MNMRFEGDEAQRDTNARLAQWLLQLMRETERESSPPGEALETPSIEKSSRRESRLETQLELQMNESYHLRFYQQLPDFALAQLRGDEHATIQYASLLYHLAGCAECHQAYLEIYNALGEALGETKVHASHMVYGSRATSVTPQRMLGHLCRALISQAEAVLKQARREHKDEDQTARSLLQTALRVSARINQSSLRQHATQDLVRVALLFGGPEAPRSTTDPNVFQYSPVLTGVGTRTKTVRRADMLNRQTEEPTIHLQAKGLNGSISQMGRTLELRLQRLAPELIGHHLLITVLLGSLIEPVRWRGGNPLAIRSESAVDEDGTLIMSLGETDLDLSDPEEHNLLETLFMLLEARVSE